LLWKGAPAEAERFRDEVLDALREFGWGEQRKVTFIVLTDKDSTLTDAAAQLVALGPDVLLVSADSLAAAREATSRIPIVCAEMFDSLAEETTSSLARPTGNVTGISWQSSETAAKRLQLATEVVPVMRRVALLTDATIAGSVAEMRLTVGLATTMGVELRPLPISNSSELEVALGGIVRDPPEALIISSTAFTFEHLARIVHVALERRLPTISESPAFADRGVLLTYGPDPAAMYKLSAGQLSRILLGAPVAEVPIEQPTRFELVANMATARALRIVLPSSIRDRVTRIVP